MAIYAYMRFCKVIGIFQESVCLMTMETGVGLPTTRFQGVDSQRGRA